MNEEREGRARERVVESGSVQSNRGKVRECVWRKREKSERERESCREQECTE